MVALTQQSKSVVQALLTENPQNVEESAKTGGNLMEIVWKKCQLFEKMRNKSGNGYNLACQVLRNLITHNSNYQFTMERIKTMCLFFKVM